MMKLEYVTADGKTVLDRITAENGVITYETGLAQAVVEGVAHRASTEAAALELLADGWSNGYVIIRRVE